MYLTQTDAVSHEYGERIHSRLAHTTVVMAPPGKRGRGATANSSAARP